MTERLVKKNKDAIMWKDETFYDTAEKIEAFFDPLPPDHPCGEFEFKGF